MATTLDLKADTNARLWTTTGETVNTTDGGVVTRWDSTVNNAHNFDAPAANEPIYRDPGSVLLLPHVDYDGGQQRSQSGVAISNFITNSAYDCLVAFYADDTSSNVANTYQNDCLLGDASGYFGLFVKAGNLRAYNWPGSDTSVGIAISTATAYVARFRHSGGSLYLSVNGGAESSIVSGNTSVVSGTLNVGMRSVTNECFNGKIGRIVIANTGDELAALYATMVTDWVTGAGGGLSIPIASYHYRHRMRA